MSLEGQAWNEYGVGVEEDGAISLKTVIKTFFGANGDFGVEAEMLMKNDIGANAGIETAFFGRRQVSRRCAGALGGKSSAGSDGDIDLLGVEESGKQQGNRYGCDARELRQYFLLEQSRDVGKVAMVAPRLLESYMRLGIAG